VAAIPDFTILVAVDAEHLPELAHSYPTWMHFKPELRQRPLVVVCDDEDCRTSMDAWEDRLGWLPSSAKFVPASDCLPWRPGCQPPDVTQREKMLTTLVVASFEIDTPYYLKLDTDCIAWGMEDWIDHNWFRDPAPAVISSPWGYTKPASMINDFNRWADQYRRHFPLVLDYQNRGSIAKHRRIISYAMFGRTDFTRKMAEFAGGRLPCPSQDTFLGACAHRSGERIQFVKMADYGWRHVGGGGRRLARAAKEALEHAPT
jgi:hypothetical protein